MEESNNDCPTEKQVDFMEGDFIPPCVDSKEILNPVSDEKIVQDLENKENDSFEINCPTDILVDLTEDDFLPPHVSSKEILNPVSDEKTVQDLENKENSSFEIRQQRDQCIMDMSPFRLKKQCNEQRVNSAAKFEQVSKGAVDDCPTGILIEVADSSKQFSTLHSSKCDEDTLVKSKRFVKGVKKGYVGGKSKDSAIEDPRNPYDFTAMKKELSPARLHWRTPSPQSMCRISKEASKIIHNLNSSTLHEDSLLCDEKLPIPIDFDNFDLDENSDEENLMPKTENSSADRLLKDNSCVSKQTEVEAISTDTKNKEVYDIESSFAEDVLKSPEYQDFLIDSPSEPSENQNSKSREDSNECSVTSKELKSSEMQRDSFDNSANFGCSEETSDVFIESSLEIEGRGNILEKEGKQMFPSKTQIKSEVAQKIAPVSKKETEKGAIPRNLSNVKQAASNLKQIRKPKSKELLYGGKQQLKKTASYDTAREPICSSKKPNSVKQRLSLHSGHKASVLDVKNASAEMKTPPRRYSVAAAAIRSAPPKKAIQTPALPCFKNPGIPRFTHQSVGRPRFSFSKSWQQSNAPSLKGVKNQDVIPTSSAGAKSCLDSSKTDKQAQSVSVSTSSKKRFCSKLSMPSPLPPEQDRKLARALFPSKSHK